EDGIRDFHVTGVQTCALPIWPSRQHDARNHRLRDWRRRKPKARRSSVGTRREHRPGLDRDHSGLSDDRLGCVCHLAHSWPARLALPTSKETFHIRDVTIKLTALAQRRREISSGIQTFQLTKEQRWQQRFSKLRK